MRYKVKIFSVCNTKLNIYRLVDCIKKELATDLSKEAKMIKPC